MTGTTLIFDTFLAPAWYKTYLYIVEYVERTVGIPSFLLNGETLDDFGLHYADAGFVNALSYIQLLSRNPCPVELIAAPILQGARDPETPPTFFDIVVRKESKLTDVSDLERCVWAYHAGIAHTEDQYLFEQGTPAIDFKEMVETSSQAQSLRLILDGKADATAIQSQMLDLVRRNSPSIAERVRILGTYSYTTGPLVVVASHLKQELKQHIQEALLKIQQDPFCAQRLQEGQIERFIAVNNQHYQNLRERYWREEQPAECEQRELQIASPT